MGKEKKFRQLIRVFTRITARAGALDRVRRDFGTGVDLYPSEIHTIEAIGMQERVNVTELAGIMGVTKGAVSQMIRKLEGKGMITRFHPDDNSQQVFVELTASGALAFEGHAAFHGRQYEIIRREMAGMKEKDLDLLLKAFGVIERSFEAIE